MNTHSHIWSKVTSRLAKTMTTMLALAVWLQTFGGLPKAYGYAVDIPATGRNIAHSSFHYDMTRVLALGAGFTVDEAEYLASATEAMDNGLFRGYTGVLAIIKNIQRFPRVSGDNSYFYHWGRRGPDYPKSAFPQAQSDTCIYFDHSRQTSYGSRPCRKTRQGQHIWEIYEIRDWALNGALINPPGKRPVTARTLRGPFVPVRGKTLEALAIYVHTLADSYSHDLCMQKNVVRQHNPASKFCTAQWHTTEEFADGQSVPTTIIAANEVWKVLKENRDSFSACKAPAPWTDAEAQKFIETFVKTGTAGDGTERANYGKAEFNKIAAACKQRAALFDLIFGFDFEDANLALSGWNRS